MILKSRDLCNQESFDRSQLQQSIHFHARFKNWAMRLLINIKEMFLANILMMREHQVKLKQTLIVEIGFSVLNYPIERKITMRTYIPSLSRDQ